MRVLVLIPGGTDSQVLFSPTLSRIHQTYPNAEIAVAADPAVKEIYQLSALVKEFIPYSFQARNSPADWANLLGVVRDREFEVVITATEAWSTALLLWLSGIPTRIGYASSANNLFLTQTVPRKSAQYRADEYHDLLQGLGISESAPPMALSLPQKDVTWAEATCQEKGLSGGYVLFYPGQAAGAVGAAPQSYPLTSWEVVLKDFQARQPQLPLVVLQAGEATTMATALGQAVPEATLLQPQSLGQTAALIAGADLLITTDSLPLYLAVALNVFAVGLFAGGKPTRQLPPAQGDETRVMVLQGNLAELAPEALLKQIWNG